MARDVAARLLQKRHPLVAWRSLNDFRKREVTVLRLELERLEVCAKGAVIRFGVGVIAKDGPVGVTCVGPRLIPVPKALTHDPLSVSYQIWILAAVTNGITLGEEDRIG